MLYNKRGVDKVSWNRVIEERSQEIRARKATSLACKKEALQRKKDSCYFDAQTRYERYLKVKEKIQQMPSMTKEVKEINVDILRMQKLCQKELPASVNQDLIACQDDLISFIKQDIYDVGKELEEKEWWSNYYQRHLELHFEFVDRDDKTTSKRRKRDELQDAISRMSKEKQRLKTKIQVYQRYLTLIVKPVETIKDAWKYLDELRREGKLENLADKVNNLHRCIDRTRTEIIQILDEDPEELKKCQNLLTDLIQHVMPSEENKSESD